MYELDADIPADLRQFIKPNSTYARIRDDKVIIKVSLHWKDACDAEMAKRTKGPSSANGNEAVKQQEVKVKPEEVNVKPEVLVESGCHDLVDQRVALLTQWQTRPEKAW